MCVVPGRLCLSWSGCGFLVSYHFGAAQCFRKHGSQLMRNVVRHAGCSGGSLVAALLAICPDKLDMGLDTLYQVADEVNALKYGSLNPAFSLADRLRRIVDDVLPADMSQVSRDRLFVSVTKKIDGSNKLISEFVDREHLIRTLMASCFIPVYSTGPGPHGQAPQIDGDIYIDGGLSDNLPKFDDLRTITISPFSGEAEISPHDLSRYSGTVFDWSFNINNQKFKVNVNNMVRGANALFPPCRSRLEEYRDMGFRDAMKYLLDEGWFERPEGTPV